jgi:hypothetical protein
MLASCFKLAKLAPTMEAFSPSRRGTIRQVWFEIALCGLTLLATAETMRATPPILADSPLDFFTNVAARVLLTEMNVDLNHIEVYPTNQYTPAVHRLLQVTANVYDATTTNYFPSVFRPLFTLDGAGDVFISGFTNVPSVSGPADPQLESPLDAAAWAALPGPVINLATNVYGIPWIIGVKKGFPNFNEFVEENILGVTRRLQVTRDLDYEKANFPKIRLTGTNQMYIFSLNSSMGLDFWNSYNSNFANNVTVVYRGSTWLNLTNDDPGFDGNPTEVRQPMGVFFANTNSCSGWPGTTPWIGGQPNPGSFFTPLNYLDYPVLTNSVYRTVDANRTPGALPPGFNGPCLIPANYFGALGMTVVFETNMLPTSAGYPFPLPHWGLLTTNRLQAFILDFTGGDGGAHVIDYVQIEQVTGQSLNAEIFMDDDGGVWNTNIDRRTGVPIGIENQIIISRGLEGVPTEDGVWQGDMEAFLYGTTPPAQQASFGAFFAPYGAVVTVPGWGGYAGASASNFMSRVVAPYAPTRFAVGYTILQVNDPLVHYLASDLTPSLPPDVLPLPFDYNNSLTNVLPLTWLNLGSLNLNYQPWGGNPYLASYVGQADPNAFNLAERDPLVSQSDDWDFSDGQNTGLIWLGQVHRGTPWQTIYLKSPDILASPNGLSVWTNWTGDANPADAIALAPTQDWQLASLLAVMFNTNNLGPLFSVNNPNPNAWRGLLNSVTALTNTAPGQFDAIVIASNSPQASIIANAIQTVRSGQRNELFLDAGDVFTTPQLSTESPFLNTASANGINDEAYEAVPAQLLPLIRADSIGTVLTTNGQMVIQFTGYDGHTYAIQSSANLVDWTNISTNSPAGGVLNITNASPHGAGARFYRSILLN